MTSRGPPFDVMSPLRRPTCVGHGTVMTGIQALRPKGLRYYWVVTGRKWLDGVATWDERVRAVDEDEALPGVSRAVLTHYFRRYGLFDAMGYHGGHAVEGWYLTMMLAWGFILRPDVLDTLVLHNG